MKALRKVSEVGYIKNKLRASVLFVALFIILHMK